jgi:signal transduction histidine kinase
MCSDDFSAIKYRMSPAQKARLVFILALVLLLLGGLAVSITIQQLASSARWVAHSYDVKAALGEFDSSLSAAARARFAYVHSGDEESLRQYDSSKNDVRSELLHIRELTHDNPTQQAISDRLQKAADQRIQSLDESVALQKSGHIDQDAQDRFTQDGVKIMSDIANIVQQMQDEEQKLLGNRRRLSGDLFTMVLCILIAVFALSAVLFWVHYWLLRQELQNRNQLENNARNLSARLLTLQDEERRKFSRELHDSVGQLLALAKMNLGVLFKANPDDNILAETNKVVGEALSEIRTVSYLLHPPLLDELGLSSAIKWYLDGFAQRSGIQLYVDIDADFGRLSHPTELVLFRALQESLTNVHRHSKSPKVEVSLHRMGDKVSLRVRDYGKGISSQTLKSFLRTDAETGVGLAGMRERIREQLGQFEIQSDGNGTLVLVTMPVSTPAMVQE